MAEAVQAVSWAGHLEWDLGMITTGCLQVGYSVVLPGAEAPVYRYLKSLRESNALAQDWRYAIGPTAADQEG